MIPSPILSETYLAELQQKAAEDGKESVVGALIKNSDGKIFLQRRKPTTEIFPDCWDIAGGHVDPGETIYRALEREIEEETGFKLVRLLDLIEIFDWETKKRGKTVYRREFDFTVEVSGDLTCPSIEDGYSTFLWVGQGELADLKRNMRPSEAIIFKLVEKALKA